MGRLLRNWRVEYGDGDNAQEALGVRHPERASSESAQASVPSCHHPSQPTPNTNHHRRTTPQLRCQAAIQDDSPTTRPPLPRNQHTRDIN